MDVGRGRSRTTYLEEIDLANYRRVFREFSAACRRYCARRWIGIIQTRTQCSVSGSGAADDPHVDVPDVLRNEVTVMSFFRPAAWWWATLAIVIALVYLWHFGRKQQPVATFFLWQRALARRPAWFRLRFWLSLATQLLIVLLLVAALAEPYWTELVAGRRNIVLVLDVSASMSATDVKPTRFAQLKARPNASSPACGAAKR